MKWIKHNAVLMQQEEKLAYIPDRTQNLNLVSDWFANLEVNNNLTETLKTQSVACSDLVTEQNETLNYTMLPDKTHHIRLVPVMRSVLVLRPITEIIKKLLWWHVYSNTHAAAGKDS